MDAIETRQTALPVNDDAKDFFGKTCPNQPGPAELLVLPRGPWSNGCDMENFGTSDGSKPDFDVLELYKEARPSVVYFKMEGKIGEGGKMPAGKTFNWGGSGFIIEAENGKSLIVTDNHVVAGTGMDSPVKVTDTKVVLANGKMLDGKIVAADPSRDLALVEVNTGADTSEIKAIKVAKEELKGGGEQLLSLGQPYTSDTIYTSQGPADRIAKRSDFNRIIKPLEGENPDRDILVALVPIRTGFSGAAMLNKKGEAVAVVDIETSFFSSLATPISQNLIDELKAKRTDK